MSVAALRLSSAEETLVGTIYAPPRARRMWMLKDVLPDGATRYYSMGRWALVDALLACGVGSGDRVLVPGLICREVLASVNVVGATAVFYPVSRALSAAIDATDVVDAKAVLAVNYFGFPQDLGPFRKYCTRTGAALIEDNAHGFLSRDADGRLLGSRGDAGVFSFRKTIAVPEGGALVLSANHDMPRRPAMPAKETVAARYRVKQAFRRAAGHAGPYVALSAISAARQLRRVFSGDAGLRSDSDAETRIPVAPNPLSLISAKLAVADPELELQRRRALYDVAGRVLDAAGAMPVFPRLSPNVVPYGFPVLVSPSQVPGLIARLARHGLPLSRWPELPTAIGPSAPDHYRHLWVVPFLW